MYNFQKVNFFYLWMACIKRNKSLNDNKNNINLGNITSIIILWCLFRLFTITELFYFVFKHDMITRGVYLFMIIQKFHSYLLTITFWSWVYIYTINYDYYIYIFIFLIGYILWPRLWYYILAYRYLKFKFKLLIK